MAVEISFPGVFVEEVPTGIHPIEGVATSTAAFVGRTRSGPLDGPVHVQGYRDFVQMFGSGSPPSTLDHAVRLFFENGGSDALIVRVGASRGGSITDNAISAPRLEAGKRGLWALDKAKSFNLLCIPPLANDKDIGPQTRAAAIRYCEKRGALFIADPSVAWQSAKQAVAGLNAAFPTRSSHAALFFPFLQASDPASAGKTMTVAPCGAVAGVMARTDAQRGVWRPPAGTEATLNGVAGPAIKLSDSQNGELNALGVNCLRTFTRSGPVVWGARTLAGADQAASEWKYIPVRRLAFFIEQSIQRGIRWAVFEPNAEPAWAKIRLNVGAFMDRLFRNGAFQGRTARQAYFVKCDATTTSQSDIDAGIANVVVGFAPLKPAEFVIITIRRSFEKTEA
jgi:phage tail sheath protein FI